MTVGKQLVLSIAALVVCSSFSSADPLFNGKDLQGWRADVPKADNNPDIQPSFIVRDGKLVSLGHPRGHLITERSFKNYRLSVEYRFSSKSGKAGNCGLLVHVSKLRVLAGMFPQSIEVQMLSGHAGDFWCIGENIEVPEMEKRRPRKEGQKYGGGAADARRILKLTDGAEKKTGEWNSMVIECKNDEIRVWMNGTLVNHGTRSTASEGRLAIQAEGAEVEFRTLDLKPLEGNSEPQTELQVNPLDNK